MMKKEHLAEELNYNDVLPEDILGEIWSATGLPDVFNQASLVCRFWKAAADKLAENRFKYYFPDLYYLIKNDPEYTISAIHWPSELHAAFLQYCCDFTKEELESYRAFRAGDWGAIQKIFISRDFDKIFLKDNQGKTGLYYFSKKHDHPQRQTVFDELFNLLSKPFFSNGQWVATKFDSNINAQWGNIIESFDDNDHIPAILLLAILCNQHSKINTMLSLFKHKDRSMKLFIDRLLLLSLTFEHVDTFLMLMLAYPKDVFLLEAFLAERVTTKYFASRLFQAISELDLSEDPAKRNLMHWALILNQSSYLATLEKEKNIEAMNQQIIAHYWQVPVDHPFIARGHPQVRPYLPIQFACLWGDSLYQIAVEKGASPHLAINLLEISARNGNAKLLNWLLSRFSGMEWDGENLEKAMVAAIEGGKLNCVRILMKKVNLTPDHIQIAFSKCQLHILNYFYYHPSCVDVISSLSFDTDNADYWLPENCHIPSLKMLLKFGMNPNLKNHKGFTPLHFLSLDFRHDHSDLIRQLIKKGALVDATIDIQPPLESIAAAIENEMPLNAKRHMVALIESGIQCQQQFDFLTQLQTLKTKLKDEDYKAIEEKVFDLSRSKEEKNVSGVKR